MTTTEIVWKSLSRDEKIALVKPMFEGGDSAQVIADAFEGVTRNMVIGVINRAKSIKKRPRKPPAKKQAPPKPKPRAKLEKPVATKKLPPISASGFSSIPDPPEPTESVMHMINNNRPPLAGKVPVDIMGLPNRPGVLCRFPVIGGYCGVASGDKMYCRDHDAIMYRETEHKIRVPKGVRL